MVIGGNQSRMFPFCQGDGKGVGKSNATARFQVPCLLPELCIHIIPEQ